MFKKVDLINTVSENLGVTKKEAEEKVVEGFIKAVKDLLADVSQDGLDIYQFMEIKVSDTKERKGRNPKTGETVITPPKTVAKAKLKKNIKNLEF